MVKIKCRTPQSLWNNVEIYKNIKITGVTFYEKYGLTEVTIEAKNERE